MSEREAEKKKELEEMEEAEREVCRRNDFWGCSFTCFTLNEKANRREKEDMEKKLQTILEEEQQTALLREREALLKEHQREEVQFASCKHLSRRHQMNINLFLIVVPVGDVDRDCPFRTQPTEN